MNQREWKEFCKVDPRAAYFWYNKVKEKVRSGEFNSDNRTDENADTIHHLRDTEKQRKYNDEHYEMFGYIIDENGNEQFNYGDYVVFWTQSHHNEYHSQSEETRKKRSESQKKYYAEHPVTDETRAKRSASLKGRPGLSGKDHPMYGKHHTEESRQKMRDNLPDQSGENNPFYGKRHSEESRKKISESGKGKHSGENNGMYGKHLSDDHRRKMSESLKKAWTEEKRQLARERNSGENAPMFGRHHTEETKQKIREKATGVPSKYKGVPRPDDFKERMRAARKIVADQYKEYKLNGGTMTWGEFQHYIKNKNQVLNNEQQ